MEREDPDMQSEWDGSEVKYLCVYSFNTRCNSIFFPLPLETVLCPFAGTEH